METTTQLNNLLAPRFLFRFSLPVKRKSPVWGKTSLDESYRLADLAALDAGTASQEPSFADVRMAWDTDGIAISLKVTGKGQPLWCRESRIEDSDGLVVWIDTRATHNIHRASKFCHSFALCNATLRWVLELAERGIEKAAADLRPVARAINLHAGAVTNQAVAETFDLKFDNRFAV